MKTLVLTLLFALATAFSQEQPPAEAQQQPERKQGGDRRAALSKLQADLDQAASRAKFTDEQRKQFDEARQALRQQARQRGGRRNRTAPDTAANGGDSAREALKTLRNLTSSEAFQPDDREMLRKDLDAIMKSAGRSRQGTRTRKSAA
jgi:hypothetical protein